VLNAANEVAVNAFIRGLIPFPQISAVVARVMERHALTAHPRLEQILEADAWARQEAAAGI
jgi:1-deoxy-D-xylulose-5-phosphate reductoisomerase